MTMKISRSGSIILLSGVIDEHADFMPLMQEPAPLSIDFSGVERINSIGLRSWMRFMTKWADKPLIYLNCPVVISDQLAIIPALRGIKLRAATVESAFIPYDCNKCQHQEDFKVLQKDAHPNPKPDVLNPKCPACSAAMDLVNSDQLNIFEP
jgi:hypothetical protein